MGFENKYLSHIAPYKLASHGIWEVDQAGRKNVLKLDWNEATISPSPRAIERVQMSMRQPDIFSLYPSTFNAELVEKLSHYTGVNELQVQYFPSSDVIHELFIRTFGQAGDSILLINPTYDNFRLTCESQGCTVHFFDLDEGFVWNKNSYIAALQSLNCKLAYICNPNNPTGNLIPIQDIEQLIELFPNTLFLIDEAYYEFSSETAVQLINSHNNIIVSRTFSKAFALANFRIGYAMSCSENMEKLSLLRNAKNISSFSQEAACGVLEDMQYTENYVQEVIETRQWFAEELSKFEGVKTVFESKANFVLVEFNDAQAKTNCLELLSANNIFVRNLTHSKILEHCIRFTVGTKEQMQRVLNVLIK